MTAHNNTITNQPDTWLASLLGALFFFLAGLQLIFSDIPHEWAVPGWLRTTDWLFIFGLLAPAAGFAAGWALGFPRWSYPYTGGLLAYSFYLMNTSTPFWYNLGYEKQVWGWRAWIPFLIAALVGYLLSRRLSTALRSAQGKELHAERRAQPAVEAGGSAIEADSPLPPAGEGQAATSAAGVRAFFTNIRRDPSLATYAMFAWMPLIIISAFDEITRPYSLVFMILLTGFMVATALVYHRTRRQENRSVFLAIGLLATLCLTWIGSIAYWLPLDGVYLPGALIWGALIIAVMLWPIWLMRRAKPGQKADA